MLRPHFIFLENRGYQVEGCTNGIDALERIEKETFDIVLLDENMPGLNGLETLSEIKNRKENLPVVMITKNEAEQIMEEAIGTKISDYLIKPVNPNQILLSLKKILNRNSIVAEQTTRSYQKEFGRITLELSDLKTPDDWIRFYQKLVYWEMELENLNDSSMFEIYESQLQEANRMFGKFVATHYSDWMQGVEAPTLSHQLLKTKILPELSTSKPTLCVVVDNLRYDQWKTIAPEINTYYRLQTEKGYYSILPTATQYSRNAIFSGLTPLEMEQNHPDLWKNDIEAGGKNMNEEAFLKAQFKRLQLDVGFSYHKIARLSQCQKLRQTLQNHTHEMLTVVVYNFVDMISHAKTEMEFIKELAPNDKAYRSLTRSWFKNSALKSLLEEAARLGFKLILTTDHGTINVASPTQVIGDKTTSLNLRYKTGKSVSFDQKTAISCKDPKTFQLPAISLNSNFIFAMEDYYFVYKNNYNQFVHFFRNTYQHGGASLQEMIVPFVVLNPR